MSFKSGLQTVIDNRAKMKEALDFLRNTTLMVGIPEANGPRRDGPASNAVIGYVQEHGDAARNQPARPYLIPGVHRMDSQIQSSLKAAGKAALKGDKAEVKAIMTRLGSVCVTSVRNVIDEQQFSPLAPATVLERLRKLNQKARVDMAFDLAAGRVTMAQIAAGQSSYLKILRDTSSMFNAITFVLRNKQGQDVT